MKPIVEAMTRRQALGLAAAVASTFQFGCRKEPPLLPMAETKDEDAPDALNERSGAAMKIHYLEVVTKDVASACQFYAGVHGVSFSAPVSALGNARTAELVTGGKLGVRAPMHDGEKPVTRAYLLVDDIQAAVDNAAKAGAVIAVPPMTIEGHGQCAICILGGIEAGFWQL
jgi:predicted enzyme related to lactoylglutathione lyase